MERRDKFFELQKDEALREMERIAFRNVTCDDVLGCEDSFLEDTAHN